VGTEPALDLGVGALVVYGGHGLGRVTARSAGKGDDAEGARVVLEFPSGLTFILPLERAETCLRPPASVSGLEAVRAAVARQRRLTARTKLSSAEQKLHRKAREQLAADLAVAAGIDEAQAETWIESQLDRNGR
jgi:RNA polymerase-interacting CarD/CdnL/TRCF family regulator